VLIPKTYRSCGAAIVGCAVLACLIQSTWMLSAAERTAPPATFAMGGKAMTPTKKAEALGIKFEKLEPGYLNRCVKSGKLLFTSGHTSKIKGRLGKDLQVEDGAKAARECCVEILRAVWNTHGTLDHLRVVKVFGCVNSTPDFIDQPKVINGCSDMLHEIFGAKTDGWHARSALGFVSLPNGVAVEIEAIFEIKD
jgi:enamine deaminase RidA (YjgF/YER057c/UK114 family)